MCVSAYVCVSVCAYMYSMCVSVCACVCAYVYECVSVCAYMYSMCVSVCAYMCVCVCMELIYVSSCHPTALHHPVFKSNVFIRSC